MKNVIFVLTARDGSKRLPNKNMKILKHKPLIFWTINSINKAYKNPVVYISTDSVKIANYCKNMNIIVPFIRPKRISKDNTSSFTVVKHLLNWLKKKIKNFLNI